MRKEVAETLTESKRKAEVIRKIVHIFDRKVAFEDLARVFDETGEEKWPFVRACLLYEAAVKCGRCEDNIELRQDIEMALLCSSVEAISEARTYIIFKDWLLEEKSHDLSKKSEKEIRKILNYAYQEYVDTEPDREGAFFGFRKFLANYCPKELRESPIELYDPKVKGGRQASFDESVSYIYANFRSLFIHTGIGRATVLPPPGFENAIYVGFRLLDSYRGKGHAIDLLSIVGWFENVVKESLWNYLDWHLIQQKG